MRFFPLPHILSAILLLLCSGPAGAGDFDPQPAVERLTAEGPQAAYTYLRGQEARWAGDPTYDYWLGAVALQAGHPQAAVSALERVVLQQPENAGAHLDLAIAYYKVGDLPAAERWLDRLQARFDPPAKVREVVARYRERIERRRSPWQAQPWAALDVGYNDNVNGGTEADRLTLYFDGEPLEVTVAETTRPRGDAFLEASGGVAWRRHGTGWQPRIALRAKRRRHRDLADFDDQVVSLGVGARRTTGPHRVALTALGLAMRLGHEAYLRAGRAGARYRWAWRPGLQVEAGGRLTAKRYRQDPVYDADVAQLRLGLRGRAGRLSGRFGPAWSRDRARRGRPGGDRREWRLEAQGQWQPRQRLRLRLRAHYAVRRDAEAYSPALFGDRRRVVRRRHLQLTAGVRLWDRLDWRTTVEWADQSANIPLFAYNRREIRTGLAWGRW